MAYEGFSAKVLADSYYIPTNFRDIRFDLRESTTDNVHHNKLPRITTMEWTFSRDILAEVNTHRMRSANAASSRAIPHKKQIERMRECPFIPVFQKNQSGMQSSVDLSPEELQVAEQIWLDLMEHNIRETERLALPEKDGGFNIHKQFVSRPLEPWMHTTIIISMTDWDNLFALRCHPMANPAFRAIADKAWGAMCTSQPKELKYGEWHLPLADDEQTHTDIAFGLKELPNSFEESQETIEKLKKVVSVGRCARISYLNHEGKRDIQSDIALHDRLCSQRPGHWSPFEHQATPATIDDMSYKLSQLRVQDFGDRGTEITVKDNELGYCGNFKGFKQYRKEFEEENIAEFAGL